MLQSEVEQIFFSHSQNLFFSFTRRRILISRRHLQSMSVNKAQTHKKKQLQKWCKGGEGGKKVPGGRTSRKRRVLLRTATTSIPCHLFEPWLRRLRALPQPQAPSPSQARTKIYKNKQTVEHEPRCYRDQQAGVQSCCYRRSIFKRSRLARREEAPPGLSSLEASSIFSRKPAASSWHSEELDKVSSEKEHTLCNLQHKGQI